EEGPRPEGAAVARRFPAAGPGSGREGQKAERVIGHSLACFGHIDRRIRWHVQRRGTGRSLPSSLHHWTPVGFAPPAHHSAADARRGHRFDLAPRLSPSAPESLLDQETRRDTWPKRAEQEGRGG